MLSTLKKNQDLGLEMANEIIVLTRNDNHVLPLKKDTEKGPMCAVNLDGGGPSTFIVREADGQYKTKNTPSDGSPRAVSNALFLMRKTN